MERRFELRKEALLEEAEVNQAMFRGLLERLVSFVEPFASLLDRKDQQQHAHDFISGLISDLDRKNTESIAYRHDQDRKELQHFIGQSTWDHQPLIAELCRQVGQALGPETTTQATAIRLLMNTHQKASPEVIQAGVRELLERRNADGGWGQLDQLPSDAYATGQSLYVLRQAGMDGQQPEIHSAIQFLVTTQREDGSWLMTSRAHPGAEPYKNPVPITYFGSAWGTLGLLSVLPEVKEHE